MIWIIIAAVHDEGIVLIICHSHVAFAFERRDMYNYTWYQWFTFFYLYCFFGWIFESAYVSAKERHFVNRGFLRLPMLPLYGSGAVMMLWVSIPFLDSLVLTYISGFIGATALEYVTGYMMERLFKVRYWDYSDKRFNIHGYISLGSSVAWGFLTIFMTHLVHKPIERAVLAMPLSWNLFFVYFVTIIFVYDSIVCTKEAISFGKSLEAMKKLRAELNNLQVQTDLLKMNAEDHLQAAKAGLMEQLESKRVLEELKAKAGGKLDGLKDLTGIHLDGLREKTLDQLTEMLKDRENRFMAILKEHRPFRRDRIRSNPSAVSPDYAQEFETLKKYFEDEKKEDQLLQ